MKGKTKKENAKKKKKDNRGKFSVKKHQILWGKKRFMHSKGDNMS